jgi:hypothetical protein
LRGLSAGRHERVGLAVRRLTQDCRDRWSISPTPTGSHIRFLYRGGLMTAIASNAGGL